MRGTPKLERCRAKAAELGISVMTVRRMIWRFEADGPEGLIDQRTQRPKNSPAGTDARWLDMAQRVLAEHAESSRPTQDLILAEIGARLDAEHGDGAVPVPRPTRARALLREVTKGTSTFGGTKAKTEIAGRQAAPYVRLRAMRPGEYQPTLVNSTSPNSKISAHQNLLRKRRRTPGRWQYGCDASFGEGAHGPGVRRLVLPRAGRVGFLGGMVA